MEEELEKWLNYLILIAEKLDDFKYKCYEQFRYKSFSIEEYKEFILKNAPCNYDLERVIKNIRNIWNKIR